MGDCILRAEKHALVLDCGTGLYDAAPYLAGCAEIDVLLTHLHYDHILGLLDSSAIPSDARVRVYISGSNLLMFSKFKLWDVEMGGNGLGYPIQRVYNAGIQLTF